MNSTDYKDSGFGAAKEKDPLRRMRVRLYFDFLAILILMVMACFWAWDNFITSPPYVSETRYPIRGIDISAHNGLVNFRQVAGDGITFAFIKASEGATFCDENFHLNHTGAVNAGLRVGAYHFFRFDVAGVPQARNFLKTVGNHQLDLGLVIDVEQYGNPVGIDPLVIQDRLTAMVEYLNLKGYRVMFYTNRDGYYDFINDNFKGQPLWICGFSDPPISEEWTFWQFNHRGNVKGINGNVDLNVFNGSRRQWYDYLLSFKPVN